MRVSLVGNDFSFDDFKIDELHFSTTTLNLDTTTATTLRGLLTRVMERIVGRALNDALPAIPIPTFTLPPWLSDYGLPGGQVLGIVGATLSSSARHLILSGGFGLR
jgi:hypothetical protein